MNLSGLRPPATVRVRLTALYGGLFLLTATILLVTVDLLLQRALNSKVSDFKVQVLARPETWPPRPYGIPATAPWPPPTPPGRSVAFFQRREAIKGADDLRSTVLGYQWLVTGVAIVLLAVVAVVAGWWLAGRVLRPLHHITATARRLSLANLDERIDLKGPRDELKELADTFDAMLGRLEQAVESQRRFVANASHELRTPLAIQRAAIQIGLADASPERVEHMRVELLEANRRSERLIDGLLTLAQGERGLDARRPVRLDEVVREAAEPHRRTAREAGITIRLDTRPVTVTGDAVLLTRLAANLVHNAVVHNLPEQGTVWVTTSVRPEAAVLTVENTGEKLAPELVAALVEPFQRGTERIRTDHAGVGLGLAIVKSITQAHDGTLSLTPRPAGGLCVTVQLPAAPQTE